MAQQGRLLLLLVLFAHHSLLKVATTTTTTTTTNTTTTVSTVSPENVGETTDEITATSTEATTTTVSTVATTENVEETTEEVTATSTESTTMSFSETSTMVESSSTTLSGSVTISAGPAPTMEILPHYVCFDNDTLDVENPDPANFKDAFSYERNSYNICETTFTDSKEKLRITGCNNDNHLVVTFLNEKNSPILRPEVTYKSFIVYCISVPASGINHTLHFAFTPELETQAAPTIMPKIDIDFQIRLPDGNKAQTAFIGDPLYWTIDIKVGYNVKPLMCEAVPIGGPNNETQPVTLVLNGCSLDKGLFGHFSSEETQLDNSTVNRYTASFLAFRFYSHPFLKISCNILACPGSEACEFSCEDGRRKRSSLLHRIGGGNVAQRQPEEVEEVPQKILAETILEVLDRNEMFSAAATNHLTGVSIVGLAVLASTFWIIFSIE